MSNLGNRDIFSKNLKYYIEKSGKDRKELAEIWGFPYSTVTDWINGNKYPRIDRIEIIADYFGILKSDLIEEKSEEYRQEQKSNDAIADIVAKLRKDELFLSVVESLMPLDAEMLSIIKNTASAFKK